jgi:hypothetical protein
MKVILFLILFPALVIFLNYLRYKLSRWEIFIKDFESVKRPELKAIYGLWSEFRQSSTSYPLGNNFLKVAVTPFGLYLQYDLKYEPIKFYKPVTIPWDNIFIKQTKESVTKGFDEYRIIKKGQNAGSLFLQIPISDQIKAESKNLGIKLNVV